MMSKDLNLQHKSLYINFFKNKFEILKRMHQNFFRDLQEMLLLYDSYQEFQISIHYIAFPVYKGLKGLLKTYLLVIRFCIICF